MQLSGSGIRLYPDKDISEDEKDESCDEDEKGLKKKSSFKDLKKRISEMLTPKQNSKSSKSSSKTPPFSPGKRAVRSTYIFS